MFKVVVVSVVVSVAELGVSLGGDDDMQRAVPVALSAYEECV